MRKEKKKENIVKYKLRLCHNCLLNIIKNRKKNGIIIFVSLEVNAKKKNNIVRAKSRFPLSEDI